MKVKAVDLKVGQWIEGCSRIKSVERLEPQEQAVMPDYRIELTSGEILIKGEIEEVEIVDIDDFMTRLACGGDEEAIAILNPN